MIATSEGSLSVALILDLLTVVGVVGVDGGGAVAVDVVAGVGVCADAGPVAMWPLLLWFFSLSSAAAATSGSLSSCWYISSIMGFHNRTLALMNQFDT